MAGLSNLVDKDGVKLNVNFDSKQLTNIAIGSFFILTISVFIGSLLANKVTK